MSRPPKYRDITIRGVTYPTVAMAAEDLDVSPITIHGALRRGTLDHVGLGRGYKPMMPVCIDGVTYPNGYAAADAFGVTAKAVWQAINDGDPDRIAKGRKGRAAPNRKPIEIGPLTFPSYAAAGQSLGVSKSYISQAFRCGSPRMWERLVAAAMRLAQEQERTAA